MKCANSNLNFVRKTFTENERKLWQSYWDELTQLYGTYTDYYVYDYQLSSHDFFYGEEPLAPYLPPKGMRILVEVNNESLLLSKFGVQTDADATIIIPIDQFRQVFGGSAEPKSHDLIRLTELGLDRPGGMNNPNTNTPPVTNCEDIPTDPLAQLCEDGIVPGPFNCHTDAAMTTAYDSTAVFDSLIRGAPIYEITERRDEDMSQHYNMLQGHYVWIIHAKRFDYTYEPDAPREPGSDQVSDEEQYGKLPGGTNWEEKPKPYEQNITDESNEEWDYDQHEDNDTSFYGDY
jgi:hypothetical protein